MAAQCLYICSFHLMAITGEPLKLRLWNFVVNYIKVDFKFCINSCLYI
jgi:hypothetical protein